MRKLFLAAGFLLALAGSALAQNKTCPTRPLGDNTNACASTAFVYQSVSNSDSTGRCTTSGQLGMDPTNTSDNLAAWNMWTAQVAASPTHTGCIHFGPGVFKFSGPLSLTMPNGLYQASSTTTNTVPSSFPTSLTFTIQAGKNLTPGMAVNAVSNQLNSTEIIVGTITSYNNSTGVLVMNATAASGTGTYSSWALVQNYLGTGFSAGVNIEGSGPEVTTLVTPPNVDGLTVNASGTAQTLNLHDLSIATAGTSNTTACMVFINAYPFFGNENPTSSIRNVYCRGADGMLLTNTWGIGININGWNEWNIANFQAFGPSGGSSSLHMTGILIATPGANGCISAQGPWQCGQDYDITESRFNNVNIALTYSSNTQFVKLSHSWIANSNIGIYVPNSGTALQGLNSHDNEYYVYQYSVYDLNGVHNLKLGPNDMYSLSSGYPALYLTSNYILNVVGNQFTGFAGNTGLQPGIAVAGPSHDTTMITGNNISASGGTWAASCIYLGPSSTGVNVQSNTYGGCATKVNNAGTGNTIGGGSP